jgi:hypothetical protein
MSTHSIAEEFIPSNCIYSGAVVTSRRHHSSRQVGPDLPPKGFPFLLSWNHICIGDIGFRHFLEGEKGSHKMGVGQHKIFFIKNLQKKYIVIPVKISSWKTKCFKNLYKGTL